MLSRNNPRWGAPRIHGELWKLGVEITEPTVAKYMERHRKPPSQTWRTFLANHDSHERSLRQKVRCPKFVKSVVYTIITNGGPPNYN